jgi:hypothetical protein
MLDYSTGPVAVPRPNIWGYHFAGVVATSEDGKDRITLENYNRSEDINKQLGVVFDNLLDQHKEAVENAIAPLEGLGEEVPVVTRLDYAYQELHKAQNQANISEREKKEAARQSYFRLIEQRNDKQAWYFQIYGSGQGQTFHERQAATGFFANPMTARVGKLSANVEALQMSLSAKLDQIPAPHASVTDAASYAEAIEGGKRQIEARTTVNDVKEAFNEALRSLTQVRIVAHVQKAVEIAQTENIENDEGMSVDAIGTLIGKMQTKRDKLSYANISGRLKFYQIFRNWKG